MIVPPEQRCMMWVASWGQHLPVVVRILEIDDVFANGEAVILAALHLK
jgi:hypothetical protein